jgi:hypothetical protein
MNAASKTNGQLERQRAYAIEELKRNAKIAPLFQL